MIHYKTISSAFLFCAALGAQTTQTIETQTIQATPSPQDTIFFKGAPTAGALTIQGHMGGMVSPGGATFEFVRTEMGFEGKTVKGAPYSAEGVTETTQTLPDGNRIVHKSTALYYRDSEGRVRNEQTLGAIGPWASANPPKTIFINDPVAGVNYVLNPQEQTADKLPAPEQGNTGFAYAAAGAAGAVGTAGTMTRSSISATKMASADALKSSMDVKTESLGTQTIEGVQAQGTRSIMTIPAGQIGNEKDLQTVTERWYSSELQTVIMRKQSDPRFGDTTYRLTNIQRADPPRTLFEVPSDYKVNDVFNMKVTKE